ncbi:hypothetical protein J6590_020206 [Homalodisca vitripennis]|nr:hypothetical protein J6590_020206 [Homalodisca vitripennis]
MEEYSQFFMLRERFLFFMAKLTASSGSVDEPFANGRNITVCQRKEYHSLSTEGISVCQRKEYNSLPTKGVSQSVNGRNITVCQRKEYHSLPTE